MKIIRVVLNLGEQKMFILCEYKGLRKNLKFEWAEAQPGDLPPASWLDTVTCEMQNILDQGDAGPAL